MNQDVFIIAEAGVNHNGSLEMAKHLIDVAVSAGADAVKFQSFRTEKVISKHASKAEYQKVSTGTEESQFEMVKKLELDEKVHQILVEYCEQKGIQFLSTPFDVESLDMLVKSCKVPLLKIPSGEITNAPLLLKMAITGLPLILSTGMATIGEVEQALGVLAFGLLRREEIPSLRGFRDAFCSSEGQAILHEKVTILHCTTEYPAPIHEVNLRAIETLRRTFGLPVGYSDHTDGITIPIAAVALGATIIEKHFTLDQNLPGPDHRASLEPDQLKAMVSSIRQVSQALGNGIKIPSESEIKNKTIARKSLVASRPIVAGEPFTEDNITAKRPGNFKSPMYYWEYLGQKASKNYSEDEEIE